MGKDVPCKRCGKPFDWKEEEQREDIHPFLFLRSIAENDPVDLCPKCLEALRTWLNKGKRETKTVAITLLNANDKGYKHTNLEADWREDVTLEEIIKHYENAIEKVDV